MRIMMFSAIWMIGVLTAACLDAARVSPKPPRASQAASDGVPASSSAQEQPALETPNPENGAAPVLEGARSAIATPNTANGSIEIVITERPPACGRLEPFPATCESAWRV